MCVGSMCLYQACVLASLLPLAVDYAVYHSAWFGDEGSNPRSIGTNKMNPLSTRRDFLRTTAAASAGLLLSNPARPAKNKSVLLFTKSSGFEHAVIKTSPGNPSIAETAIRGFSVQNKFDLTASKDGRIFDSKEFHNYAAVVFFTTGDLTQAGTDGQPPMSAQGKQAFLDAVRWIGTL